MKGYLITLMYVGDNEMTWSEVVEPAICDMCCAPASGGKARCSPALGTRPRWTRKAYLLHFHRTSDHPQGHCQIFATLHSTLSHASHHSARPPSIASVVLSSFAQSGSSRQTPELRSPTPESPHLTVSHGCTSAATIYERLRTHILTRHAATTPSTNAASRLLASVSATQRATERQRACTRSSPA